MQPLKPFFEGEPGGAVLVQACPWNPKAVCIWLDLFKEPRQVGGYADGLVVAVAIPGTPKRAKRKPYALGVLRRDDAGAWIEQADGTAAGPVVAIAGVVVGASDILLRTLVMYGSGLTIDQLTGAA